MGRGRCKERIQEGKPDQRSETRGRSTRWFPKPFPSTGWAPAGHRAQQDTHKRLWRGHSGLRLVGGGVIAEELLYDSPLVGDELRISPGLKILVLKETVFHPFAVCGPGTFLPGPQFSFL